VWFPLYVCRCEVGEGCVTVGEGAGYGWKKKYKKRGRLRVDKGDRMMIVHKEEVG
jgi:hypothetical protein